MLNAIFEEAQSLSKASASVASGDWSGWSATELDDLVKDGEAADALIGKIVRSERAIPDNLWESLNRKYSHEELSGSISHFMHDDDNGRLHLRRDYVDLLTERDKRRVVQKIAPIASGTEKSWYKPSHTDENGNQIRGQQIPWDTAEIEKAKTLMATIDEEKRKAAARKGLATKQTNKDNANKEGGEGLRPVMTEHWHRWMPDEIPDSDISWEKLRPRLKTQSKLDIDLMLREMEKVGVVAPNEHGSKVFRVAKYREIMDAPRDRFAHSNIKDFGGTNLAKMQMIRKDPDPALISVGMPLSIEKRWQKDHPKLYAFLKQVRKSNHKAVYKGIRPFGWARIDKLDSENWLIEEIQQDVDNMASTHVGSASYNALSHADGHKDSTEAAKRQKENIDSVKVEDLNKWLDYVRQHEAAWQQKKQETGVDTGSIKWRVQNANEWMDASQLFAAAQASACGAGVYEDTLFWWNSSGVEDLIEKVNKKLSEYTENYKRHLSDAEGYKAKVDAGEPESAETMEWQKDVAAMKEVVEKFPRWAIHAIKQAAKEHGVKNLWWVTYNQKRKFGHANPPRSFTSDALARKFGFKKVPMKLNPVYSDQCYPLVGSGVLQTIANGYTTSTTDGLLKDEEKYLWMAPVSEVVTEATKPLSIDVFM